MKKKIAKVMMLSLTGVALITFTGYKMNATVIANERPLAGITLSLDKYYEMVADNTVNAKTMAVMSTGDRTLLTNTDGENQAEVQETDASTDAEEVTEDETDVDDIININYDRLGISNVDNYLNIRKKPSEDAKILGKLPKYAGCNVYKVKDGWASRIVAMSFCEPRSW